MSEDLGLGGTSCEILVQYGYGVDEINPHIPGPQWQQICMSKIMKCPTKDLRRIKNASANIQSRKGYLIESGMFEKCFHQGLLGLYW